MKKLTEAEEDAVAMSLMNLHGEMPEEVAADFTPVLLAVVNKLGLKPAIARAAAQLQFTALALAGTPGEEKPDASKQMDLVLDRRSSVRLDHRDG